MVVALVVGFVPLGVAPILKKTMTPKDKDLEGRAMAVVFQVLVRQMCRYYVLPSRGQGCF